MFIFQKLLNQKVSMLKTIGSFYKSLIADFFFFGKIIFKLLNEKVSLLKTDNSFKPLIDDFLWVKLFSNIVFRKDNFY